MFAEYAVSISSERDFMLTGVTGVGQVNERIARIQETYAAQATSSWLESLERSLAQMKDYQVGLQLSAQCEYVYTNNIYADCEEKA